MTRFNWIYLGLITASLVCTGICLPEYCGKPVGDYSKLPEKGPRGEEYKLRQAHVLIRHGDRTRAGYYGPCWPDDTAVWDCTLTSASIPTIKLDQHYLVVDRVYRKIFLEGQEPMKGDCAIGVLTFEGYKQQELNGQLLRKIYVDTGFLKPNYSYTDLYFRSDDESRTMQSAQALALGMYPPSTIASERTQVVDIHTMDRTFDDIQPNALICPKLTEYNNEFMQSAAWKHHYITVTKPLLLEVQKALGANHTFTIDDLDDLTDCIHTHQCHGFHIPAGITDDLFQRIVTELVYRWTSNYNYPTHQRYAKVGIGFLVKDMWQAMQEAMKGVAKKFLLYSGHDSTLMPFLSAFNVSDGKWPPYASVLQFELYEVTGSPNTTYAVRMLYHGKEVNFPFCDVSPCSMVQFEAYVNTIIPQNPETDCKVSDLSILQRPPMSFLPSQGRVGT